MTNQIRLETARRLGVDNSQGNDQIEIVLDWTKRLSNQFIYAVPRGGVTPRYNCHGLTFASRRTSIYRSSLLDRILADDGWSRINEQDTLPGDIVLYHSDDNEYNHSGIVVAAPKDLTRPMICSKWGRAGEFVHRLDHCPASYGPRTVFFRCAID